jgi:hypothetical protein
MEGNNDRWNYVRASLALKAGSVGVIVSCPLAKNRLRDFASLFFPFRALVQRSKRRRKEAFLIRVRVCDVKRSTALEHYLTDPYVERKEKKNDQENRRRTNCILLLVVFTCFSKRAPHSSVQRRDANASPRW